MRGIAVKDSTTLYIGPFVMPFIVIFLIEAYLWRRFQKRRDIKGI